MQRHRALHAPSSAPPRYFLPPVRLASSPGIFPIRPGIFGGCKLAQLAQILAKLAQMLGPGPRIFSSPQTI